MCICLLYSFFLHARAYVRPSCDGGRPLHFAMLLSHELIIIVFPVSDPENDGLHCERDGRTGPDPDEVPVPSQKRLIWKVRGASCDAKTYGS